MQTSAEICIFAAKKFVDRGMMRLKSAFLWLVSMALLLLLVSWTDGVCGPLPQPPVYSDSSQWFIRDRGAEADLFYIISTETGYHMIGSDTCHFADTYDDYLRGRMEHEMYAVDSFYSGRLNYFSPYYRQISLHSWTDNDTAMHRLPLAIADVKRSWQYYLDNLNQGRPFILAGFSQGAHALSAILQEMPDSVYRRMVAAYVIGYKVTQQQVDACPYIKGAQGATDTGVTICFNSLASPDCDIDVVSGGNVININPVNWRTDTVGARFVMYGRKGNDTLTAHLDSATHLLVVDGYKDQRPMALIGKPGNYHHLELKFYYPYIRQNMADRVAAFLRERR